MRLEDRITITPGVRGGKPCIKGTRITVYDILEYLAGGMTESEILADFPSSVPKTSGHVWHSRPSASGAYQAHRRREAAV